MDVEELRLFELLMETHHRYGMLLGFTTATSPEQYFGFHHEDVKEVHTYKLGEGGGIWFRLRNGRVVDQVGLPDEADPSLYDRLRN